MVFKMEAMTEEDKEYYYSFGFIRPTFSSRYPNIEPMPLPKRASGNPGWTIDRERNAFLLELGGHEINVIRLRKKCLKMAQYCCICKLCNEVGYYEKKY